MNINVQARIAPVCSCEPSAFINHPSGYLALSPKKDRYTVEGLTGFISYREQGKHLISMGGVHAPENVRGEILDSFIAEAEKRRRGVIILQVPEEQTDIYRARGFTVNQLGTSYGINLIGFSLRGTRYMKLRNKIKRARKAGLSVHEVGKEIPADEATYQRIHSVSNAWLREKGGKELDFLIGEIGSVGEKERRIFAVTKDDGQIVGFITYVPVWGEYPGYLHDITRRLPETVPGAMELCNAYAIERFIAENVPHLHFGFTPFIVDKGRCPGESRPLAWFVRAIGRYGSKLYPAQRQVMYKLKWSPQIIQREYIACRPLSLRALIDTLILTRSI